MNHLFGFSKSVDVILKIYYNKLEIRKNYASIISKEVGVTYSHLLKILKTLEDVELIESSQKGRIKFIKLTTKGKVVARKITEINNIILL